MAAVEAATEAWNRAEPGQQIVGISYVATVAEMLTAAYAEDVRPPTPSSMHDVYGNLVDTLIAKIADGGTLLDVLEIVGDSANGCDYADDESVATWEKAKEVVTSQPSFVTMMAALFDAFVTLHPVYSNTTGPRGGIGGQAMTPYCAVINPYDAEQQDVYDRVDKVIHDAYRWREQHPS